MPGQKFGRYVIIRELRRGGMATVYRAYDPRFEREVAIKVLPRELLFDPQFRVRFEREAKALAALEHPAIVPVYDFGEQDGQLYLVMRFMPGGSLEDRLKQGTLNLEEAARILARLAPALDEAHTRGMVHRDLKPANILFDQRGDPYITDFGVVKISGAKVTDTGMRSIGTPAYMSPEQARGEPDIDGRSDIFALGAVLFEMLTGKIPYDADTPAGQLVRRITDPIPNILELRPDLPAGVQEIIARSLAKRRYVRFGSASDMARAIDAVARGGNPPVVLATNPNETLPLGMTPPPGPVRPVLRRSGRFNLRLPIVAGAMLALTAVFVIGYQALSKAGIGGNPEQPTPIGTSPAVVLSEAESPTPFLPLLGTVIELQGVAQIQASGDAPRLLSLGDVIPYEQGLHLWTTTGRIKVRLTEGPLLWLAEDTSVLLDAPAPENAALPAAVTVKLERGLLLAKARELNVLTDEAGYRIAAQFALLGIQYDPALVRFVVDCLEGSCTLGAGTPVELTGGLRGGFDRQTPLPIEPVSYVPWLDIGGQEVATPTPTPTETPTPTSEPTRPPKPTKTPIPAQPTYSAPVNPVQQPPAAPTATQRSGGSNPRPTSAPKPDPTNTPSSNDG